MSTRYHWRLDAEDGTFSIVKCSRKPRKTVEIHSFTCRDVDVTHATEEDLEQFSRAGGQIRELDVQAA